MNMIQTLWNYAMINNGIIPALEYEMLNGDWLVVDIELTDNGLRFSFDNMDLSTWFSGDIIGQRDGIYFILPFDDHIDSLDDMLARINDEIIEGFLIPNNLYK